MTNILVILTISILVSVLGLDRYISAQGINYTDLAAFCLVWGMAGSLFSLAISRISAKMMTGMTLIDRSTPDVGWLYAMVEDLSRKAGLPVVPQVGVYDSPEVNAFATGPSKRRSLVAFSRGLLTTMNKNEVEGVAAHEIAHIANGDMVTMTLLQGVINAFVMFLARAIGWALSQSSRDGERSAVANGFIVMALQMVLGLLGMLVVCAFSRYREFRADHGGARYAGKQDMIAALERLANNTRRVDDQPALAAFKISSGASHLFSTHPPLEKRIEALRRAQL
ncbi:MAG: protease HtpX [Pseudomonadota bacterium]